MKRLLCYNEGDKIYCQCFPRSLPSDSGKFGHLRLDWQYQRLFWLMTLTFYLSQLQWDCSRSFFYTHCSALTQYSSGEDMNRNLAVPIPTHSSLKDVDLQDTSDLENPLSKQTRNSPTHHRSWQLQKTALAFKRMNSSWEGMGANCWSSQVSLQKFQKHFIF